MHQITATTFIKKDPAIGHAKRNKHILADFKILLSVQDISKGQKLFPCKNSFLKFLRKFVLPNNEKIHLRNWENGKQYYNYPLRIKF